MHRILPPRAVGASHRLPQEALARAIDPERVVRVVKEALLQQIRNMDELGERPYTKLPEGAFEFTFRNDPETNLQLVQCELVGVPGEAEFLYDGKWHTFVGRFTGPTVNLYVGDISMSLDDVAFPFTRSPRLAAFRFLGINDHTGLRMYEEQQ